VKLACTLQ